MSKVHKVDLFLLGFQKSGTTSMAHYLSRIPNVYVPKIKEVQFFSNESFFAKGEGYYHSFFPTGLNTGTYFCDASPQYIASKKAIHRIATYRSDAKYILVLRDRRQRMLSHYRMIRSRGVEMRSLRSAVSQELQDMKPDGIIDEISMSDHYVQNSLYGALIQRLIPMVPPDNLFLFSQDAFRNPIALATQLSNFLKIPVSPDVFSGQYNTGSDASFSLYLEAVKRFPIISRIGKLIPENRRRTISRSLRYGTEIKHIAKQPLISHYDNLDQELAELVDAVFDVDRVQLRQVVKVNSIRTFELGNLI